MGGLPLEHRCPTIASAIPGVAAPFRKHRERRGAGRSTKDSIATRRQLDYVAEALTPPTLP